MYLVVIIFTRVSRNTTLPKKKAHTHTNKPILQLFSGQSSAGKLLAAPYVVVYSGTTNNATAVFIPYF